MNVQGYLAHKRTPTPRTGRKKETDIYIYIYILRERERERNPERVGERGRQIKQSRPDAGLGLSYFHYERQNKSSCSLLYPIFTGNIEAVVH